MEKPHIFVRLEADGSTSFLLNRTSPQSMGLFSADEAEADTLEGLFTDKSKVTEIDSDSDRGARYIVGNNDAFNPNFSGHDSSGRWVKQEELKFGPLPQNSLDVSELRYVYTQSMPSEDVSMLLNGLHAIRVLRHEQVPAVIPQSAVEMAAIDPVVFAALLNPEIDRLLPPIRLPEIVKGLIQKPVSRRGAMKAVMLLSKLPLFARLARSLNLTRPVQTAERIAETGLQAKPA